MNIMRNVFQVLHVSLDDEPPEQGEIGKLWIVNLDKSPGVLPSPHLSAGDLENVGAGHHREGNARLEGLVLGLEVLVLVGITVGELVDLDVVLLDLSVDLLFQPLDLLRGEAVGFGNDGDKVHFVLEASQELEVDLPKTVAVGRNEVEAAVDSRIDNVLPVEAALSVEKGRELVVDVLNAGLPGAVAIEDVAESGRVHDRQPKFHALLLDLHGGFLDLDGFLDSLLHRLDLAIGVEVGEEERVDQRRFPEARFSHLSK